MPTLARMRRDGVPMHNHPTIRNTLGRWHGPAEHHANDNAHEEHEAATPIWAGRSERYFGYAERMQLYRDLLFSVQAPRRRRSMDTIGNLADRFDISQRRFGVEIECLINVRELQAALIESEVPVQEESYNHSTRRYWKITTDASVQRSGGRGAGLEPREIVSPILKGTEGLRQLEAVCKSLTLTGAMVNRSCGLHVHHDATGISIEQMKRLVRNYMDAQVAIDKVVSRSRRTESGNTYCSPFNSHDILRFARAVFLNEMCDTGRYRNLNIAAYNIHKTVEFRQHQGTIDFKKIASWIQFGQRLVDWSLEGNSLRTRTEPADMLNAIGMPTETIVYYIEREKELFNARELAGSR